MMPLELVRFFGVGERPRCLRFGSSFTGDSKILDVEYYSASVTTVMFIYTLLYYSIPGDPIVSPPSQFLFIIYRRILHVRVLILTMLCRENK